MLDIQLQIFKCVAERSSFSLAAKELHMTQSSVSQQIQNLECYYGVKLFDRMHRRIMLTQAGTALYPYAVELARLYQEASQSMHGLMDVISGQLDIGASLTIGEYMLPEMLVEFSRLHPCLKVSMTIENTEKVISNLIDGTFSLGFVEGLYEPVTTLIDNCCGGDDLVVIAPPAYSLPTGERIPLAELMQERWVLREPSSGTRRVFEQFAKENGCNPGELNIIMELSSTEAIKRAVKAGLGLGAMSRLAVENEAKRGELVIIPLAEGPIHRTFTMLYHREKFRTTADKRFTSFVLGDNETRVHHKILQSSS